MEKVYHAIQIKYLTEEQLAGFHKYKYRCQDTSPLSIYVMHPFWNWVIKFFPYWIAPNLMTFVGWLLSVANFCLLSYYDWDFMAGSKALDSHILIPYWVWIFCGFSQFSSHTLDGIDGKQARRTGSSSPLGELFDHGLDSTEALLMPIAVSSVIGAGPQATNAKGFLLMQLGVCIGFYTSHWEKYNTSVLYLPWVYDFSQLLLFGCFLITGIFGTTVWNHITIYGDWTVAHCVPLCLGGSSVLGSVPISIYNMYRTRQTHPEWSRSLFEGLMPLIPISVAFSLLLLWAFKSPSNIIDMEPRIFYIAVGAIFANITCRLIVSQMSGSICERFNSLIYPLLVIVPCSLLKVVDERNSLYFYCAFVVLAQIHYGICVVNQLCDHLQIRCFKVSTPKFSNGTSSSPKEN